MSPAVLQREAARAKGNAIRMERAQTKRRCRKGEVSVAELVSGVPPELESMAVIDVLTLAPRWGVTRAGKLLHEVQINERRKLGELTARQRALIARRLRLVGVFAT